jgi:hypothetical protein
MMMNITPLIRLAAKWRIARLAQQQPASIQEAQLLKLVDHARSTRFGRDHEFDVIKSVSDFQDRVPLRSFETFWKDYWQAEFPWLEDCTWPGTVPFFARTSGTTTGVTKYIPCTHEMLHANLGAARDVLVHHLINRPSSAILGGKTLMLGGSTDLREEAQGIRSGDLSGIMANEGPWWTRWFILPPSEIALLGDWEEKIDRIAHLSLQADIRAISGTPNWLLVLFERLSEVRADCGAPLVNHFPNLELLVHGGIDFKPYAERFRDLLQGSHAELREVYPASEGFIAFADRGAGEGLRLIVDNGIFYEFVPSDELDCPSPKRHWIGTVETGVDYAIVLSTCAGVWGYMLGDTVRFIETDPPRLLVTGRTSYVLSAVGEHLIDEEIEDAVATAAERIGASIVDYSVAPIFPDKADSKARHHYVVEFSRTRPTEEQIAKFRDALDERLCVLNADYSEHRAGDLGLLAPKVEAVLPGTFRAWMKSRSQLGGQHKVPRVINDPALWSSLRAFRSA